VRVWIDITNSPQVLFFRPLIALLRQRGSEVLVTTREFAQTTELLTLHGIEHDVVGPPHGGAGVIGKSRAMAGRVRALRAHVQRHNADVALSHASHELPLVARSLGIPSAYAFDYEFARTQHGLASRAASRVVVPDAIPQHRLSRLGARAAKVRRYPGLKEEYYLGDVTADRGVFDALGIDGERIVVVVRTPPDVSLYHRHENPLFTDVLARLDREPGVQAVALPRTAEQRAEIRRGFPSLLVPEHVVDARSLVALADLVVSAGGTMNREAVALGVPVYTTFAGELGAVDESLVSEGRLRILTSASELVLEKRSGAGGRIERDPAMLLDLLLTALER
jgi:predicted glycosyltransferase